MKLTSGQEIAIKTIESVMEQFQGLNTIQSVIVDKITEANKLVYFEITDEARENIKLEMATYMLFYGMLYSTNSIKLSYDLLKSLSEDIYDEN